MSLLGKAGPVHGTGTRQFAKAGDTSKAEVATGVARGKPLGVVAPAFPDHYPPLPCTQDPELWQPAGWSGPFTLQIEAAKAICADCPALQECRDWAITVAEPEGIWGGTTPVERVLWRKRAGLPTVRGSHRGFYDEHGRRVS